MSIEQNPEHPAEMPIPAVYEGGDGEKMSLRTYAAIQLRVPDSGIKWLDKMIQRSREMDKASSIFAMQP